MQQELIKVNDSILNIKSKEWDFFAKKKGISKYSQWSSINNF